MLSLINQCVSSDAFIFIGTPGPIRTGDPLLRRQMLYPPELQAPLPRRYELLKLCNYEK